MDNQTWPPSWVGWPAVICPFVWMGPIAGLAGRTFVFRDGRWVELTPHV